VGETMLFPCSHGADAPERATVPFIAAATAAASGKRAVVVCTIDAVHLGVVGAADEIADDGMPRLAELMDQLVSTGGEVWLCSACVAKRGLEDAPLAEGVSIVGAAVIVSALTEGRAISLA
jgi:uncharacterized protein